MQNLNLVVLAIFAVLVAGCNKKKASSLTASPSLFSDDFNRADGNLTASSDWTVDTGTVLVTNQKLQTTSSIAGAWYSQPVDVDSFVLSATVSVSGGTISSANSYLVAKFDSPSVSGSGYYCGFSNNRLALWRDSSQVAVSSSTQTLSDGTSWILSLTMLDGEMTCAIAGTTSDSVSYTDSSPFTGQYFGIATSNGVQNYMYFDDFQLGGI